MAESLTLIDAQVTDIDQLLALIEKFYQHFGYPYNKFDKRQTLEDLFQPPIAGHIWLIQQEQNIVGYVYLSFYFSLEFGGRTAFIDELFILSRYRGQGLGSQVIDLVAQKCREWNFKAIHLESERSNEGATKLYLKLGFVDYDRRLLTKKLI